MLNAILFRLQLIMKNHKFTFLGRWNWKIARKRKKGRAWRGRWWFLQILPIGRYVSNDRYLQSKVFWFQCFQEPPIPILTTPSTVWGGSPGNFSWNTWASRCTWSDWSSRLWRYPRWRVVLTWPPWWWQHHHQSPGSSLHAPNTHTQHKHLQLDIDIITIKVHSIKGNWAKIWNFPHFPPIL